MKRIVFSLFLVVCLALIRMSMSSYSNGITGASTAGCSCHGQPTTTTVITVTGLPTNYVNGQAYSVTLTISNASKVAGGFDLNFSAGTVSGIPLNTALTNANKELFHTSPKSMTAGSVSWAFTWTAPATGSTTVTMNIAGNAVDLLNGSAGDSYNTAVRTVAGPVALPLSVTATNTSIFCNGNLSTITCTGAGGASGYQYRLNAGAYQVSNTFTNNAAGTYTVTVRDANNATASTIKNISQPTAINITGSQNPVSCFGGSNGNATILASGGTPGYTYSWSPFGGTGSTALNLTAGIYTVTVTDGANCTKTSSVVITQPALVDVTATASATVSCIGNVVTLTGANSAANPNYTYVWSGGVQNNVPFVLNATTTYTVTGTSSTGCTDQGSITVNAGSVNQAAQASASNSSSLPGTVCATMTQLNGATENYTSPTCGLVATVQHISTSPSLGSVTGCVTVLPNVPTHVGQPYVARYYVITPTTQGSANITLYFTHDDLLDYNAFITNTSSSFPLIQFPNINPQNNDVISNLSISKVDGGVLGVGTGDAFPVMLTYDGALQLWKTTFTVTSFSGFYLHTTNLGNAALDVNLISLQGANVNETQQIKWVVDNEKNMKHYRLEWGASIHGFKPLQQVIAKNSTTSSEVLNYNSVNNNPVFGHNYYRLIAVKEDGVEKQVGSVIDVWRMEKETGIQHLSVHPNPATSVVTMAIESAIDSKLSYTVMDMTGKLVRRGDWRIQIGLNEMPISVIGLPAGMYTLRVAGNNFSLPVEQVIVK
jgi:hypothetical protein